MFLVNIQGYSNYASKKIFVGMGNVVRIRGGYVSYSAFQQAALFLSFTVVVLLVSNSFFDFKNYHRNEKLDEFGKKIIYARKNCDKTAMLRHPVNTACKSCKEYRNKKIKEKEGKIAHCSDAAILKAQIY